MLRITLGWDLSNLMGVMKEDGANLLGKSSIFRLTSFQQSRLDLVYQKGWFYRGAVDSG